MIYNRRITLYDTTKNNDHGLSRPWNDTEQLLHNSGLKIVSVWNISLKNEQLQLSFLDFITVALEIINKLCFFPDVLD